MTYKFELNGVAFECDTADELMAATKLARNLPKVSESDQPSPAKVSGDKPVCKGVTHKGADCRSTILLSNGYCRMHGGQSEHKVLANDARTHVNTLSVYEAACWVKGKGVGRRMVKIGNRSSRTSLNQALYYWEWRNMRQVKVQQGNRVVTWNVFSQSAKAKRIMPKYRVNWEHSPGYAMLERVK